ncbi:MAG: hypothetical protein IPG60_07560 [Bacteroidetes bacterium]|nr:hypothetical protein [Bacteroidota bacterium]
MNPSNFSSPHHNPFGMLTPGRNWNVGSEYRFGFNGKEGDSETYGEGNAYDFGARIYDARLGRWMSVDRLFKDYPALSSYNFSANSPIWLSDKDGEKIVAYDISSQDLVLSTLRLAFGSVEGFSFIDNQLVHNGNIPAGLSEEQILIFNYISEVLIESNIEVNIRANASSTPYNNSIGETNLVFIGEEAAATTVAIPRFNRVLLNKNNVPYVEQSGDYKNVILVPTLTMENGNFVETTAGKTYASPEYILFHEWGHAIINIIENEFNNQYNGQDFSTLTEEEKDDFSIRFSNTLNQMKNSPQETGMGQHGRSDRQLPATKPKPLTK